MRLALAHMQCAHVLIPHHLGGLAQRRLGGDLLDFVGHDLVDDGHGGNSGVKRHRGWPLGHGPPCF